ncbi:MAG: glutamate--tRNA ligase [Anaerolineales bacterium]
MKKPQNPARVRFAPSPTGYLHIGGARTALYDYLLARQTGGSFILRIEDTDQKRYVEDSEKDLKRSLRWLGLDWEEGPDKGGPHAPYRQSKRKAIYQQHARTLIEKGHAYPCFCSPERLDKIREEQIARDENPHYDQKCRDLEPEDSAQRVEKGEPHVIRFKSPNEGSTTARDLLRGEITVKNETLNDIILIKSNGLAVYHLAAMVDDHLMDITHVIRGAEWLPTFPIHTLIYDAFGWKEPEWVHLSLLLKPDGKGKLSKRDMEEARQKGQPIFVKDMEDFGYLPETVNNWLALMGWSYDDKMEFFPMNELIEKFSLEKLNPSPAAINFSKLDHFNGIHIRELDVDDFARRIKPYFEKEGYEVDEEILTDVAAAIQTRTGKLTEVTDMAGFFFEEEVKLVPERIISGALSASQAAFAARRMANLFNEVPMITRDTVEKPLRELTDELDLKAGHLFGLLREALTGQKVSPPLFDIMAILGKEEVLDRLNQAAETLEGMPESR